MSGYWDAVVAAALGAPGTARPERPPAFADEDGLPPVEMEEIAEAARPRIEAAAPDRAPAEAATAEAHGEPAAVPERAGVAEAPAPPASIAAGERIEIREAAAGPAAEPETARDSRSDPSSPIETREALQAALPPPSAGEPPAEPRLESADVPEARDAEPELSAPIAVAPEQAVPETRAMVAEATVTIAAEPVFAPFPDTDDEPRPAEPAPLTIEIGRIDIRLLAPEQPAVAPVRRAEPFPENVPSLADYLARRSEAGR